MSWAQYVEAFQKQLETGNRLSSGLPDPLAGALVFPRRSILMGLSLPNQFRYQLFSIFKEQCTESIKFLGVLRQTPRLFENGAVGIYLGLGAW